MDNFTGMMRAIQVYNLIKIELPGITQEQLVDFTLAQSEERQEWFKTANVKEMVDWLVAQMREEGYPASEPAASATPEELEERHSQLLFSMIKVKIPWITERDLLKFTNAQSEERQAWFKTASMTEIVDWVAAIYPSFSPFHAVWQAQHSKAAMAMTEKLGKEYCKQCGEELRPGAMTCPKCGNTKWGYLLGMAVFIAVLVMAVMNLVQHGYMVWAVVVGAIPAVMLILLVRYVVKALKPHE